LNYQFDTLAQRLRELAFLNKGICIKLLDRRGEDEVKEVYKYEGGIKSFVEYLNKNKNPLHKKVIYLERSQADISDLEIALQYHDGYNELIFSFANNIRTHEGGTHEAGFKTALTRLFNDYARKNNFKG
jgi:DNA gyrase subunit B